MAVDPRDNPPSGGLPGGSPTPHIVSTRYQRTYAEWRPECVCGWIGSYWKTRLSADKEAAQHKEEPSG